MYCNCYCYVPLPQDAMGRSAVSVVFPDHTRLFYASHVCVLGFHKIAEQHHRI